MPSNLKIVLHYDGILVTTKELVETSNLIENFLETTNIKLLNEAIEQIDLHPEIKKLVKSKALNSLSTEYKGGMIGYHVAKEGSIVLEALIGAIPFAVIATALKEFFGDAFKESTAFKQAKKHFSDIFDEIATSFFPSLKNELKRNGKLKKDKQLTKEINDQGDIVITVTIEVKYHKKSELHFPEYGELLE